MLTLSVGGETVEIPKLNYIANQAFKKKLLEAADRVLPVIEKLSNEGRSSEDSEAPASPKTNDDLSRLVPFLMTAFSSMDSLLREAFDLLVLYWRNSPRDLGDTIHDDEIIDNFLVVLSAAVPLGKLKLLSAGFTAIG